MAKIYQCTNPLCGEDISVPEGAVQIECKHCNTLHFTSDLVPTNDGKSSFENNPVGIDPDLELDSSEFDLSMLPLAEEDESLEQERVSVADDDNYSIPGGEEKTSPNRNFEEEMPTETETKTAVGYLRTENGDYLSLKPGKNVIGRSSTDLILADKTVSRKHCVIEVTGEGDNMEFIIYDIGHVEDKASTNGVFLSGRTLRLQDYERLPLKDGTTLEIGTVQLVFYKEHG